jgi:hypothetical protein
MSNDPDEFLEMAYEDRFLLEESGSLYDDDGRYDDDPSPYAGTYSEE